MLKQKLQDACGAADAALAAVQRCQSWQRDYLQRLAGYWLEECAREKDPARLREAYHYWRDLWRRDYAARPREQWDTIDKNLSRRIQKLEEDLAVPDAERLFPKATPSASVPPTS